LRAKGVLNNELESEISDEAATLSERMRDECRKLPNPNPLSMFDHVYSETDLNIDEQRREVETILSRSQDN
jgi:2-oxoisovalerate dehydrogenase E1 component alpha subunit